MISKRLFNFALLSLAISGLMLNNANSMNQNSKITSKDQSIEILTLNNRVLQLSIDKQMNNLDKGLPRYLDKYASTSVDLVDFTNSIISNPNNHYSIHLGDKLLEFDGSLKKYDMDKISFMDGDGNRSPADFPQMYKLESKDNKITFIFSNISLSGNIISDEQILEVTPIYKQGKFAVTDEYAIYDNADIVYYEPMTDEPREIVQTEEEKLDVLSSDIKIGQNSQIETQSSTIVNVVQAAGYGFYLTHGANSAQQLTSLYAGGGSEGAKYILEAGTGRTYQVDDTIIFEDSGPSDQEVCEYMIEFGDIMNDLDSSDPAYNPDWAWIAGGVDFYGTGAGCSYQSSLSYADAPNMMQFSAVQVDSAVSRKWRKVLTHEGGHVIIPTQDHHGNGESVGVVCSGQNGRIENSVMLQFYYYGTACVYRFWEVRTIFTFSSYHAAYTDYFTIGAYSRL